MLEALGDDLCLVVVVAVAMAKKDGEVEEEGAAEGEFPVEDGSDGRGTSHGLDEKVGEFEIAVGQGVVGDEVKKGGVSLGVKLDGAGELGAEAPVDPFVGEGPVDEVHKGGAGGVKVTAKVEVFVEEPMVGEGAGLVNGDEVMHEGVDEGSGEVLDGHDLEGWRAGVEGEEGQGGPVGVDGEEVIEVLVDGGGKDAGGGDGRGEEVVEEEVTAGGAGVLFVDSEHEVFVVLKGQEEVGVAFAALEEGARSKIGAAEEVIADLPECVVGEVEVGGAAFPGFFGPEVCGLRSG